MPDKLIIYTDGGCRHNPGPAAIGVVIQDASGTDVADISEYIGHGTNNQAEYRAVIAGLEKACLLGANSIEMRSDSQLIVEQLNGRYRVKDAILKPLFQEAQNLSRRFRSFSIKYIPREMNREADRLANQALDNHAAETPEANRPFRQAMMDF